MKPSTKDEMSFFVDYCMIVFNTCPFLNLIDCWNKGNVRAERSMLHWNNYTKVGFAHLISYNAIDNFTANLSSVA